uniref:Uncharacterized protein n=1 Tax=Timema tahoe TaxID=61484 RepID=A0A7R9ISA2_9NEOP|nr:unnamed protein product [Timema tahoe]
MLANMLVLRAGQSQQVVLGYVGSFRSLEQLKKHWNNVKARRKKELSEETRELMGTGGGPYKPHKTNKRLVRSLEQLKKHWNNVKARRKKELSEETRELMGTGGGPYKPHSPSCPEVEVVAPHINYHLGYQWDGDAVAMEDAAAKRRKISMSEVTAAFKSAGSTLAGTSLLEFIDTADIPTTSASQSLSFLTPAPQVSGSPSNTSPFIQFIPSLAPPPSSPSPPPPPPSHSPPPPSPTQPLQTPKLLQQEVLQKTSHALEERAKTSIHADKELHCERLAEAKLNHQEAKNRQQRAEERHRLDIQQAEERHRLDIQQAEERQPS